MTLRGIADHLNALGHMTRRQRPWTKARSPPATEDAKGEGQKRGAVRGHIRKRTYIDKTTERRRKNFDVERLVRASTRARGTS